MSQCRKSDQVKEGMRKVHKDLVDKGFMVKLENMEKYKQLRADSVSTPVRMVVDPTMIGFNNILAKGENRIGLIFTILIRCRCTGKVNLSKKVTGVKKPDPELVEIVCDAESLLEKVKLTRSMIVGKVSEFVDPCGFIDGNLNLADLLMKKHDIRIEHVSSGSE